MWTIVHCRSPPHHSCNTRWVVFKEIVNLCWCLSLSVKLVRWLTVRDCFFDIVEFKKSKYCWLVLAVRCNIYHHMALESIILHEILLGGSAATKMNGYWCISPGIVDFGWDPGLQKLGRVSHYKLVFYDANVSVISCCMIYYQKLDTSH